MAKTLYCPLFYGQGGVVFSLGMLRLRNRIRAMGIESDCFRYRADFQAAHDKIASYNLQGRVIAACGYSLGNSALTLLQKYLKFDLVECLAESSLAYNYPINHSNTKHSVLWHGPGILSDDGLRAGFDEMHQIWAPHLWIDIDPLVNADFLKRIKALQ